MPRFPITPYQPSAGRPTYPMYDDPLRRRAILQQQQQALMNRMSQLASQYAAQSGPVPGTYTDVGPGALVGQLATTFANERLGNKAIQAPLTSQRMAYRHEQTMAPLYHQYNLEDIITENRERAWAYGSALENYRRNILGPQQRHQTDLSKLALAADLLQHRIKLMEESGGDPTMLAKLKGQRRQLQDELAMARNRLQDQPISALTNKDLQDIQQNWLGRPNFITTALGFDKSATTKRNELYRNLENIESQVKNATMSDAEIVAIFPTLRMLRQNVMDVAAGLSSTYSQRAAEDVLNRINKTINTLWPAYRRAYQELRSKELGLDISEAEIKAQKQRELDAYLQSTIENLGGLGIPTPPTP